MRTKRPARRTGLAAAVAVTGVVAVAALLARTAGSGQETQARAASPNSDARDAAASRRRTAVSDVRHPAEEDEDEDEPGDASPADGREPSCAGPPPPERRLRVVSPEGRPLGDVLVDPGGRRTRGDGVACFPTDSHDAAPFDVTFFDGRDLRRVTLDRPDVEAVAEHLPLLEVVVVDASTGREVREAHAYVVFGDAGETRVEPTPPLRLPVSEAGEARADVHVAPPEGFGAVRGFAWSGRVARQARRVRIVAPVWPETSRTLRLLDASGAPIEGAGVVDVVLDAVSGAESRGTGNWATCRAARSDADGLLAVSGLPALPVGAVTVRVVRDADDERRLPNLVGRLEGHRLDQPSPPQPIELVLARPLSRGRGCPPGRFPPDSREPSDPPPPPDCGHRDPSPVRWVRVCVLDTDGRRVPGARVTPRCDGAEVPQVAGDVQTLTPRTDAGGCVEVAVPEGPIRYEVTLAGAWCEAESAEEWVAVTLGGGR